MELSKMPVKVAADKRDRGPADNVQSWKNKETGQKTLRENTSRWE